jgi:nitrogen regulatory protein P-II 1
MVEVNLIKKVRLEIAVNDDFVERTIKAIIKGLKQDQLVMGRFLLQIWNAA